MTTVILVFDCSVLRSQRRGLIIGAFAGCSGMLPPYMKDVTEHWNYEWTLWEKQRWDRLDWKSLCLFMYGASVGNMDWLQLLLFMKANKQRAASHRE